MKNFPLFFLAILFSFASVHSQSLHRTLIASQGSQLSQGSVKLNYSIGEPAVGLMNTATVQLSVGIHQALDLSILSVEDLQFTVGTFYPNPTSALLRIDTQDAKAALQLRISNTSGQVFLETQVTNGQEVDVQHLAQGVYFLQLYDQQYPTTKHLQTHKKISHVSKKPLSFRSFICRAKPLCTNPPRIQLPSHGAEPDRRVAHKRIRGHKISYCTRHGTKQSRLLRISLRSPQTI